MNEINTIANIYTSMLQRPVIVTEVQDVADIDVREPGESVDVAIVNIYIKPAQGAIQRPYTGEVINITELDNTTTLVAVDRNNDKTMQIIISGDDNISVTVMDSQGNTQDVFMGKNLDFYDMDSDQKELNIIKIENV